MTISITKTIPTSSWYTGSGATTINLDSVNKIIVNSKKDLIKIKLLKAPTNAQSTSSDKSPTYIKDLKNVDMEMKIGGWLIDTTDSSAWNKAWMLRAMCVTGGPVAVTLENCTFGTGSQQIYLEEVNFIGHTNRIQGLRLNQTNSTSIGVARVECDLSFYLGDAR